MRANIAAALSLLCKEQSCMPTADREDSFRLLFDAASSYDE